ncbi:MAG: hypothetical protein ABJH72_20925 [Reichenbachiella sp.]
MQEDNKESTLVRYKNGQQYRTAYKIGEILELVSGLEPDAFGATTPSCF